MGQGFVAAVLLVACTFGQSTMADVDSNVRAVSKSNTDFTTSLYDVLTKSNQGNLIFSPFSLSVVTAMLKAGAAGKTAEDVQKALKFPISDKDTILNEGYKSLLSSLKSDGMNFTLETANKIYAQTGFTLKDTFTATLKNNYGADVNQLDFSKSAAAAQEINSFVSSTTHDKIKDLISPSDLDSLTKLVLVNAIYFKGLWKNKFDANNTKPADFYLTKENKVEVPMMRMEADLLYGEIQALNAKAVALPYKGDRLSMIVLLPNEVEGLKDMEEKLKTFDLSTITENLRERKINLQMPKFTLESTIDLKDPLTLLGAGSIFDPNQADFSGIAADGTKLFVSKAIQKAFIEVNEEGSEAAAATGLQISLKSAMSNPRVKVDHPFVAMIVDHDTSSILFFTTFTNPTETETRLSSLRATDKQNGSSGVATMLPSFVLMPLLSLLMGPPIF